MDTQDRQDVDSVSSSEDTSTAPPSESAITPNPFKSPNPWLIGTDLEQARKRIRWGGGAGLAAAIVNFIVIMSTYFVGGHGS